MQVTPSLVRLTSEDFVLDNVLSIIYTKCTIVLFHSDCAKSAKMGRVFAEVAESSAGAQFGCVNIQTQKVILDAIVGNQFSQDHPIYSIRLRTEPFILAYRGGVPVAAYRGDGSVEDLINWSLTFACA